MGNCCSRLLSTLFGGSTQPGYTSIRSDDQDINHSSISATVKSPFIKDVNSYHEDASNVKVSSVPTPISQVRGHTICSRVVSYRDLSQ